MRQELTTARRCLAPALALLIFSAACFACCGGCDSKNSSQAPDPKQAKDAKSLADAEKKKKEAEAEEKKEPFDIKPVTPLLSEAIIETQEGASLRLAKPGHWTATVQPMKSNLADFEGRTMVAAVDGRGRPLRLEHTPFEMTSSRPAVLAKGRVKRVESELFLPANVDKLRVASELVETSTGTPLRQLDQPIWSLMPSHQYFLLVLAREPSRYGFLKVADSIRAPYEDDNGAGQPHYRVVLADATKPLPLPPNVLTWTSVAYIVWDEVNIDRMDPAQQRALVDWLHWGGRLIINGPDSLESLRSSFLAKYLPVDPGETRQVRQSDLAGLHETWTKGRTGKPLAPISVTRPWSAIELKPRANAVELPGAAGLFYECSVGAGSIVVSAIQLAERDLVNWSAYDSFLNGALLRRPARIFREENAGTWVGLQSDWAEYADRTFDAHFTTPLRWFARDAGAAANVRTVMANPAGQPLQPALGPTGWAVPETKVEIDRPGGVGQWSEFGPVSKAAREVLREAAGVRVPGASFVVICLAVYLIVLVPLNWMVFQALGRIEWAWIAAPILALLGTLVVVRQAQLDIGFVRSQTEIGVLEVYGDHPRGHLTRYTAMYSSLSTTYDMEFDDATAVATPFPADERDWGIDDSQRPVAFEKYDKPRLRGVTISSASTQLVHSEQMFSLQGPIRMTSPSTNPKLKQLENKSGFDLADAVVIHRRLSDSGQATVDGCWLGDVRNGTSSLMSWGVVPVEKGKLPFATQRGQAAKVDYHKRLNIDPLLKLALQFPAADDPLHGRREEYRLVARIDAALPGSAASPAASQTNGANVVLAHLQVNLAAAPSPDANAATDVAPDRGRNAYEDEPLEEPPEG